MNKYQQHIHWIFIGVVLLFVFAVGAVTRYSRKKQLEAWIANSGAIAGLLSH